MRWWITINEPSILGFKAYIEGSWPPHRPMHLRGFVRLMRHARCGHAFVRQVLRRARPDAMVSMAFAIWPMQPVRWWSPIDQTMATLVDWLWQGRIIRRTLPLLDWIGVNYYSRTFVGWPWPKTSENEQPHPKLTTVRPHHQSFDLIVSLCRAPSRFARTARD